MPGHRFGIQQLTLILRAPLTPQSSPKPKDNPTRHAD
jgi:hypothetical protein